MSTLDYLILEIFIDGWLLSGSSCPLEARSEQIQHLNKPSKHLLVHDDDPSSWHASHADRLQTRNHKYPEGIAGRTGKTALSNICGKAFIMYRRVTCGGHIGD